MKLQIGLAALAVGFVAASLWLTFEGALALYFGWVLYLYRVLPHVNVNVPTLLLGIVALLLFAFGTHLCGWAWMRRAASSPDARPRSWKIGWTMASVTGLLVLFAAGISVVGTVHQLSWLATAEGPLLVEAVPHDGQTYVDNNLRQMGMAMANYEAMRSTLPAGGTFSPDGRMLHSWETHLLPYLPYATYGIDMQKPWNDFHNRRYFKGVLPQFICGDLRGAPLKDDQGFGMSHFAVNQWVLAGNKSMKTSEIKDGAANTLLIGQVNSDFRPWGHPVNWRDPTLGINRTPNGFGGASGAGGAKFLMADGSVRFIKESIDPSVLQALSTPCGGEVIEEKGWTGK
jgi:hypothetical protein